jgi:hypothetical protein
MFSWKRPPQNWMCRSRLHSYIYQLFKIKSFILCKKISFKNRSNWNWEVSTRPLTPTGAALILASISPFSLLWINFKSDDMSRLLLNWQETLALVPPMGGKNSKTKQFPGFHLWKLAEKFLYDKPVHLCFLSLLLHLTISQPVQRMHFLYMWAQINWDEQTKIVMVLNTCIIFSL